MAKPPLRMPRAALRCFRACRAERCQPPVMAAATPPKIWRRSQLGGARTLTTTSLLQPDRLARFLFWTSTGSTPKRHCGNWKQQYGALPETVESITPRGRHIFFRCENGDVRNSAGAIAPGLDIRGDGGYVVLPPSIHPSGRPYVWSVDSADHFAEAPAWLTNLLSGSNNGSCRRQAKSPEHWHSHNNKHHPQRRAQQHADEHLWEIATRGTDGTRVPLRRDVLH